MRPVRLELEGLTSFRKRASVSFEGLDLFAITGRRFSHEALELLGYLWACTSYPDPSIWPNNTAALAGSVGSTSSAVDSPAGVAGNAGVAPGAAVAGDGVEVYAVVNAASGAAAGAGSRLQAASAAIASRASTRVAVRISAGPGCTPRGRGCRRPSGASRCSA